MEGRKPAKINFLTSFPYKNMILTASFQSQNHVLWDFLRLSSENVDKDINKEGDSPPIFFFFNSSSDCDFP